METVSIQHPFGHLHAWLGQWMNMPAEPQSGCLYCARVANGAFSASMRLVVSPGYEDEMILISPTGQSVILYHYITRINTITGFMV